MKNSREACDPARRSFLKRSGLLGVSTVAAALLPAEHAEAVLFNRKQHKVSSTRLAMGTFVAMTAIHPSVDQAEEAFGRAFDEIGRLSRLLSRHADGSPVAELNRTGVSRETPAEVQEVIARSLFYHRETGGSFDITVKPLVDLYRERLASGLEPTEGEIDTVLAAVGSSHLRLDRDTVSFSCENMGITLDGIAKGYIVDRASAILREHGVVNHLVNAGGDISTSGTARHGRKWTVAIQDPNKNRQFPDVIEMSAGAIATSGNYEVYYDREKMFHHIVDGASGNSPRLSASVSVLAPTVMEADALSTAVFVLEPVAGVAFIDRQPDCECFVVERSGATIQSAGWIG